MPSYRNHPSWPDELTSWFAETLSMMMRAGIKYGIYVGKGVKRHATGINGGPVFLYVKNGKSLIAMRPIHVSSK